MRWFNADFDGDQNGGAPTIVDRSANRSTHPDVVDEQHLSPANGGPIISADQDIVLAAVTFDLELNDQPGEGKIFADDEVRLALDAGVVSFSPEDSILRYLKPKMLADGGVTLQHLITRSTPRSVCVSTSTCQKACRSITTPRLNLWVA